MSTRPQRCNDLPEPNRKSTRTTSEQPNIQTSWTSTPNKPNSEYQHLTSRTPNIYWQAKHFKFAASSPNFPMSALKKTSEFLRIQGHKDATTYRSLIGSRPEQLPNIRTSWTSTPNKPNSEHLHLTSRTPNTYWQAEQAKHFKFAASDVDSEPFRSSAHDPASRNNTSFGRSHEETHGLWDVRRVTESEQARPIMPEFGKPIILTVLWTHRDEHETRWWGVSPSQLNLCPRSPWVHQTGPVDELQLRYLKQSKNIRHNNVLLAEHSIWR